MDSLGPDLRQMQRTPLHPEPIAALRAPGAEVRFEAGARIARLVDPADRFLFVLEDEVEMLHPYAGTPLTLIGADQDEALRRIEEFAGRNRIPLRSFNLAGTQSKAIARDCGIAPGVPAVVFGEGDMIEVPKPLKVAQRLGLDLRADPGQVFDALIVGGGPAGVAVAVDAGAERLRALVIEELAIGGQAGTSSRIENYMGVPTGISGADLIWRGEVQALKFGTRFAWPRWVTRLERQKDGLFCATLDCRTRVCARAVVVARGHRRAVSPDCGAGDDALRGQGRLPCRDRDRGPPLPRCTGGGGRRRQFRRTGGDVPDARRATFTCWRAGPLWPCRCPTTSPADLQQIPASASIWKAGLAALPVRTGSRRSRLKPVVPGRWRIPACAVFVTAGAAPNCRWLGDLVTLDAGGYIVTGAAARRDLSFETTQPGIFAVGDIRAGSVKRVASTVGERSVVVPEVWRHLAEPPARGRS
ncbi:NAD(P)/FAD-dependent oxidoreductase [Salipiger mangrovisoli]|uniref:NAD(P)/FAD-dependent oxidoreductase n=1 Tax=Salipiger mangrovisoli TaxID=2865933 RepID=UPI001F11E476|nr:FAD-dependent oxidoreductase [Salipiger mangrovisoli]